MKNTKFKIGIKLLSLLFCVHLALLLLFLKSPYLSPLSNDTSVCLQSSDFYAVYGAGKYAIKGESVYKDYPHSYPFRYLPIAAYIIGIPLSLLPEKQAPLVWTIFYEILLCLNIFLTFKLAKSYKNFLVATLIWLFFMPYYIEVYMGQYSFFVATSLWVMVFLFYKKKVKLSQFFWAVSVIIKMNTLILIPLWFKIRRFISTGIILSIIILTSFVYFSKYPQDIYKFAVNFESPLSSTLQWGNLGLFAFFYNLTYPSSLIKPFSFLILLLTVLALINSKTEKTDSFLPSFSLLISSYFLSYQHVWEHHYVLMLPVLIGSYLIKRDKVALYVAILLALPTPYALLKTDENLRSIYHASKIVPVIFYYLYLLSKVHFRKKTLSYYLTISTSFIILVWLVFSAIFAVYYERLPKTFSFLNICIAESWGNKGEGFHVKGEIDAAFSKYLKSLEYYPLVRVHRNIGAIYANKGDTEKALYHFEEYLRLKPRADDKDVIMNYCNQVKARMNNP